MCVILLTVPKIAILLGGMGLNSKLTQRAIRELPGDVTFAFAPYGDDLQTQVNKARADGHEVLLQLPMEPIGYPANNPGPKTLLADADKAANLEALHWHMSRFAGYTGITNYMGGRLLSTPSALKPVMAEMSNAARLFGRRLTALTVSEAMPRNPSFRTPRASRNRRRPDTPKHSAALNFWKRGRANALPSAPFRSRSHRRQREGLGRQLQKKGILLVP